MKSLAKRILWQRAHDYVKRYQPLIIGVTGTTGKTITKNAIAHILSSERNIRVAPHSYNTPLGVALSILGIETKNIAKHWAQVLIGSKAKELQNTEPEIIILELGADRPGDIDTVASHIPFNIGVVTNVQPAHLRLFHGTNMIAHEMLSLLVKLPQESGHAIINQDDQLLLDLASNIPAKKTWFGTSEHADIRLVRASRTHRLGYACEIATRSGIHELHLKNIYAAHQLPNILAALGVIQALGSDLKQAVKKLQDFTPPPGRMRLLNGIQDSTIIDDTYNASPEPTMLALNTLADLPARRRIAILGSMLDLGGKSVEYHQEVGHHAATVADILITVGDEAREINKAALNNTEASIDAHHFEQSQDVGKWLTQFISPEDLILVKGSRDLKMEVVVKRIVANLDRDQSEIIS